MFAFSKARVKQEFKCELSGIKPDGSLWQMYDLIQIMAIAVI